MPYRGVCGHRKPVGAQRGRACDIGSGVSRKVSDTPAEKPRPRALTGPRPKVHRTVRPAPRAAPLRPASFDADQARQAWRQFARARGGRSWSAEGQPRRWGPWLFLALGVAAAAAIYQTRRPSVATPAAATTRELPADPLGSATPTPTGRPPEATPSAASLPTPGGADGTAAAAPPRRSSAAPVVAPSPYVPRLREPPEGTSPEHAAALTRVPRSRRDRAPVGGVGDHGVHVDRIAVGPHREDELCRDQRSNLSIAADHAVQVCFRVVHERMPQRLVVHWERAGELVRRTFLSVPAAHAYRTRVWMPLTGRGNVDGSWTVIVKTETGVELARESFAVAR